MWAPRHGTWQESGAVGQGETVWPALSAGHRGHHGGGVGSILEEWAPEDLTEKMELPGQSRGVTMQGVFTDSA